VTAPLIAPVIPSSAVPRRRGHGVPGRTVTPLPLARPPEGPPVLDDLVYGIGRIDASGRVADRAITGALDWRTGDRLTLTADAGVVSIRRDPRGMVTLPARAYIVIPAALRRRRGLHAGDLVLLAAAPGEDTLAAYPFTVVDQAIGRTYRSRAAKEAGHDHRRSHRPPGRFPAGSRRRRSAAPQADGPVAVRSGHCPAGTAGTADVRGVHPGRVGRGHGGDPPGVQLVLEPGPRAVG
jgi:bifunctional DNA-binding transcriptional regulator/antitoxin component of YhaV-PrlF toxin-antitoxin module